MNARQRDRSPLGSWKSKHGAPWLAFAALGLLVAAPALADLVSPPESSNVPLTLAGLLELAIRTMLEKGVALLLLGSAAVVGIPWVVAGLAIAAFSLPGRWMGRR